MTAHDLIADIFRRPQDGVAANVRRITQAQVDYLRSLIGADEEGGAVRNGDGDSLVWMPSGRYKYVITAPPPGRKVGTLMKLANLVPSDMGRLF